MAETHINAYIAELADAERAVAEAQGRVTQLKAKIEELSPKEEVVETVKKPAAKKK